MPSVDAIFAEHPEHAGWLLKLGVRDLTERVRTAGGEVTGDCHDLLQALYAAAHPGELADIGNDDEAPGKMVIGVTGTMLTVAQLAQDSGHSSRTLRHWAATGRIRAHRVGRTWLIDPSSLRKRAA